MNTCMDQELIAQNNCISAYDCILLSSELQQLLFKNINHLIWLLSGPSWSMYDEFGVDLSAVYNQFIIDRT